MATDNVKRKSFWTSVNTLCINDEVKVGDNWQTVTEVVASPADATECIVLTATGAVLEIKVNTMIEVAS